MTSLGFIPDMPGRAYTQHSMGAAGPWCDCILFQPRSLVAGSATAGSVAWPMLLSPQPLLQELAALMPL